jgi:broad specificity phosphatase PhoE
VAHPWIPADPGGAAYHGRVSSNDQCVIHVLRHGETEWSATGRHTGRTDVPLTTVGEQQARLAGLVLSRLRGTNRPPALVLCSPRVRALRTAELAGLQVDEVTEELAEWDYGDYEGLTTEQIHLKVPHWTVWSHPIPHGETADQVGKRAGHLLDRVTAAVPDGDVVLVGHGHFGRVLVARWLDESASAGVRYGLDPAGTTVLGAERGERQVIRSNIPPWSV